MRPTDVGLSELGGQKIQKGNCLVDRKSKNPPQTTLPQVSQWQDWSQTVPDFQPSAADPRFRSSTHYVLPTKHFMYHE